ncbi:MAG: glycosyltransferase [Nostoc sp. ChiQUE02]|uniref:glycosyltransferase n=1 Tax=Nostoc sp. ChiQUE02 TaxID=3075377 RepID=UPI002AD28545|nr:glycosyltransferase [Nostoc sp. ChiQUE02]MDZ8230583.1 glycosyltransferase [Nostoc sp. ChiQUE02]
MHEFDEFQIRSTVILYVAPITHNRITGLTPAITPLVNVLQNLGVQTGLLTTSTLGRYENPEPYPVVYIEDLPLYPGIASMPEPLNKPNIIVFQSTYVLNHIPLVYEALQRNIPYIITPQGGMTERAQQQKKLKKKVGNLLFFNWMVRNSAALHCLNEQEAIEVKKTWNHGTFIVGNGVNIPQRKVLASPGSKPELKFVFLGRLDINHKGLDFLLEACALLQEKLRQSKVQILLYGSDIAGSKAKLEKMINKYQLEDIVHLNKPVLGDAKQEVFQSADLFVHTSRFEGHPIAVLEALSYGIPCLLTPGTNMADEVEAAAAGWSVEATPAAIAKGMQDILAARLELPKRGQAARNLVEEKYSWNQIGKQSLREYFNLLNQN